MHACWVVTFPCTSLSGCSPCSVETYPPDWLLSYDLSTSMGAQSWSVHRPHWADVTCPPAWLHSCYTSNNLPTSLAAQLLHIQQLALSVATCPPACRGQLWPIHQHDCSVVTCQPACSAAVTCPPVFLLSCVMFIIPAAQLWPGNQPVCAVVTCPSDWLLSCDSLLCSTFSVHDYVQHLTIQWSLEDYSMHQIWALKIMHRIPLFMLLCAFISAWIFTVWIMIWTFCSLSPRQAHKEPFYISLSQTCSMHYLLNSLRICVHAPRHHRYYSSLSPCSSLHLGEMRHHWHQL